MAWQKFRRVDTYVNKDDPIISITKDRFNLNVVFVRLAQVTARHKVLFQIDSPSYKIGFTFITGEDKDAYPLRPMTKGKTEAGLSCAARGIGSQFGWVARVGALRSKKDRQFSPKKEGDLWVIQLCPAFELRSGRDGSDIPTDKQGIYRYRNAMKEIVYIGRGNIRQRVASMERKDWDYESIEFSIVEDQADRERWEAYWINRFKEENGGRLPYYNLRSETTKESDAQQDA